MDKIKKRLWMFGILALAGIAALFTNASLYIATDWMSPQTFTLMQFSLVPLIAVCAFFWGKNLFVEDCGRNNEYG